MVWTNERIDKLKRFWSEGLSARQIALQLGGVSRNAVIGKVHRLFLSNRVKSEDRKQSSSGRKHSKSRDPSSKNQHSSNICVREYGLRAQSSVAIQKKKNKYKSKNSHEPSGVIVPISRCLRLMELTEDTCKWPIGDPFGKDFSFCGGDVNNDSPYCDYHKQLAYQKANDRRKIPANAK
ncbi:GcrA family cell cycle regulator [Candidatus Liberibacter americanus]|uniref:GcrA cell cycle regulator n=1 Tax=Candidatus Liberibacter americanus str. Sao Paulo TaxID=1261131 RepID=U6B479_9HYPH|nr:GcrA family cell cycle regulator [Candidatus Liberibacter americanus]AHA27443.1 hypothetical protein lam_060 [Candidatus Liberibacter americanus str. Sao Paulo]EMS36716.1 hypothetical protein G653_00675 [Candidatus Liberibacter americanus PW_SP]